MEAAPLPKAFVKSPLKVKDPVPAAGTQVWVWEKDDNGRYSWCEGTVGADTKECKKSSKQDPKYNWANVEFDGYEYSVLYPTWALEKKLPTARKYTAFDCHAI